MRYTILLALVAACSNQDVPACPKDLSAELAMCRQGGEELKRLFDERSARIVALETERAFGPARPPDAPAPTKLVEPEPVAVLPTEKIGPYDAKLLKPFRGKLVTEAEGLPMTVTTKSIQWASTKWIVDRDGYQYHFFGAEKGEAFVSLDFDVTTEAKSPMLPRFVLFQVDGGVPSSPKVLRVSFYKWDDYGSYLGNSADYGNDFAHSSTVKMTGAVAVAAEDAKRPMLLTLDTSPCMERARREIGSPSIYYRDTCDAPTALQAEAFFARYRIVATRNVKP